MTNAATALSNSEALGRDWNVAAVAQRHDPQLPHDQMPLIHPDRVKPRFNLAKAYRHFRIFQQDKERTSEVFHVFEAMPWTTVGERTKQFLSTAEGQRIFHSEPSLPSILDDHEALRRMPAGSLAHDYCDYMEAEGLSAAGLVHEFEVFRGDRPRLDDRVEWYNDRLRDTHDLLHLLTGLGRDTLGEQCLLAFVFKQRPSIGHLTVGYLGTLLTIAHDKTGAPIWRAVRESRKLGKKSGRIAEHSVLDLLAMPIDKARATLNIKPGNVYHDVLAIWRKAGIDPYKILADK
jgi:ubiquinone biosynthesis protein COQ4